MCVCVCWHSSELAPSLSCCSWTEIIRSGCLLERCCFLRSHNGTLWIVATTTRPLTRSWSRLSDRDLAVVTNILSPSERGRPSITCFAEHINNILPRYRFRFCLFLSLNPSETIRWVPATYVTSAIRALISKRVENESSHPLQLSCTLHRLISPPQMASRSGIERRPKQKFRSILAVWVLNNRAMVKMLHYL